MIRWAIPVSVGLIALAVSLPSQAEPRASRRRSASGGSSRYSDEALASEGFRAATIRRIQQAQPYVEHASAAFKLPVSTINAIISCESNFNPSAASSAGARGMMQLMPKTQAGWASEMGISGSSGDPKFNIYVGTYGFSKLLKRPEVKGDLNRAIAAWNWGIGNLQKFQQGEKGDLYPAETRGLIACITARKQKFERAERY